MMIGVPVDGDRPVAEGAQLHARHDARRERAETHA
jgi:hypothetical protein